MPRKLLPTIMRSYVVPFTEAVAQRRSIRKDFLRNFAKFTERHLCQRRATLLKKRLWHRCFPANFTKFPRTPFLQNTSGRLLLLFKNDD